MRIIKQWTDLNDYEKLQILQIVRKVQKSGQHDAPAPSEEIGKKALALALDGWTTDFLPPRLDPLPNRLITKFCLPVGHAKEDLPVGVGSVRQDYVNLPTTPSRRARGAQGNAALQTHGPARNQQTAANTIPSRRRGALIFFRPGIGRLVGNLTLTFVDSLGKQVAPEYIEFNPNTQGDNRIGEGCISARAVSSAVCLWDSCEFKRLSDWNKAIGTYLIRCVLYDSVNDTEVDPVYTTKDLHDIALIKPSVRFGGMVDQQFQDNRETYRRIVGDARIEYL